MTRIEEAENALYDLESLLEVLFDATQSHSEDLFNTHYANVVKLALEKVSNIAGGFHEAAQTKRRAA